MNAEHLETVIIGGGHAGLATAYHLKKQGRPAVILDENERVGDAWRKRWDSLRLFTPAKYDGLPGWRFPAPRWSFPTKDDLADYHEEYASRFGLTVRPGMKVDRVSKDNGAFVVEANGQRLQSDNVVVATGAYRRPRVPDFADELDPIMLQFHSSDYRSPAQLRDGGVLVVGVGNSGAELAFELVRTRPTWLSGRPVGEIPVPHGSARSRLVLPVIRFLGHHVLSQGTPIGRRVGPKVAFGGTPLIRVKTKDLEMAGVERVERVTGTQDGRPLLADGRVLDVANIVWCTGYRHDFPWIELPVFDDHGRPLHKRGAVEAVPGLYFVGLHFQYSVSSEALPGIGRDAARVASHLARGARSRRRAEGAPSSTPTAGEPQLARGGS